MKNKFVAVDKSFSLLIRVTFSRLSPVLAKFVILRNKLTAFCLAFSMLTSFSPSAQACCTYVDTSTQLETGFENGTVLPFSLCTYESPNYGEVVRAPGQDWREEHGRDERDGNHALKFWWTQVGYDGTRLKRGVEACSSLQIYKEGWYGFKFYLPSPGYPKDKNAAIAQIFQDGYCNSWAALLIVRDGALYLQYRHYCGTPTEVKIADSIRYNAWNPIVLHWVVSHENAGIMQVWYDHATHEKLSPTYSATNINFGFAHGWVGDVLPSGSAQGLKFGMYNYDDGNYVPGETRTIYYDCVSQLVGNPKDAWRLVNPNQ